MPVNIENQSYIDFNDRSLDSKTYNERLEELHTHLMRYDVRDVMPGSTYGYAGACYSDINKIPGFLEFSKEVGQLIWQSQTMDQLVFQPLRHPNMGSSQHIVTTVKQMWVDIQSVIQSLLKALCQIKNMVLTGDGINHEYHWAKARIEDVWLTELKGYMITQSYPFFNIRTSDGYDYHSRSEETLHGLFVPMDDSYFVGKLGEDAFLFQNRSDPNNITVTLGMPSINLTFTINYCEDKPEQWILSNSEYPENELILTYEDGKLIETMIDNHSSGKRMIMKTDHGIGFQKWFKIGDPSADPSIRYFNWDCGFVKAEFLPSGSIAKETRYDEEGETIFERRTYEYSKHTGSCYRYSLETMNETPSVMEAILFPYDNGRDCWALSHDGDPVIKIMRQAMQPLMGRIDSQTLTQLNKAIEEKEETESMIGVDDDFTLLL